MAPFDIRDRLAALFLPHGRLHGRYSPDPESVISELVPSQVWETLVYPQGSASPFVLRIYRISQKEELLTSFWRNETRVLMRLSRRPGAWLPRLYDAALLPELELGYLLLDEPGPSLVGTHPVVLRIQQDRVFALRMFLGLVETTSFLHEEGIIHRTLTPYVLRALETDETDKLWLDGFQMSAFVASWLRGHGMLREKGGSFLPQEATSLVALPPERLGPLLGEPLKRLESFSCDVFGLGMIGIDWFAGPGDEAEAGLVVAEGSYDAAAHRHYIDAARERLKKAGVPPELRKLLERMIEPYPQNRVASAPEVRQSLLRLYPELLAQFEAAAGDGQSVPQEVYFLSQSTKHIYEDGGCTSAPERRNDREYGEFIERDLTGGAITWSPDGFGPWDNSEAAREARVVLLGRRYAYFCKYLDQGSAGEEPRILLVKHMLASVRAQTLWQQLRRARMPAIRASFYQSGSRRRPASGTSWRPLVETVRFDGRGGYVPPLQQSVDWLVRLQEAELAAKEYPYVRISEGKPPAGTPRSIIFRSIERAPYDPKDEDSSFLELLARDGQIPEMGDAFKRLSEAALEEGTELVFRIRNERRADVPLRLTFSKRLDAQTVLFNPIEGEQLLPEQGFVRIEDQASRHVSRRQRLAASALAVNFELSAQLQQPRSMELATQDDLQKVASRVEDAATGEIVRKMFASWPIFILQGPPGTGKTFVASHVILDMFRMEPYSRILVSAQSNDALDNILETVVKQLPPSGPHEPPPLIIRVVSRTSEESVSSKAQEYLTTGVVQQVRERHTQPSQAVKNPALLAIQREWRKAAKEQQLDVEMFQRVQRAASIVFATCAGAGANNDALRGGGFDLVVIEEAARAWLNELAIPMVQSSRWILIGDQAQLPAFRSADVQRLLRRDINEQITAESVGRPASEAMQPYLEHFRYLMETNWNGQVPRQMLTEQRRMHPEISELVSRSFYQGKLSAHRSTKREHKLKLDCLKGRAFVWLDTSRLGAQAYEIGLVNKLEAQFLGYFIKRLGAPPTHEEGIPPLAVLTPYLNQLRLLPRHVPSLDKDVFHSVDSYQGRQAEVVLVSLVRNNSFEEPKTALGFLREPERANVMFSRARRLLVILGSLEHFERFDVEHWKHISHYVRSDPRFLVDVGSLGFQPQRSS